MSRSVNVWRWAITITIALISLTLPAIVATQSIDFVGMGMWRSIFDIQIQGNYIYCAFQKGLVILDISNPDSVTEAGKLHCYGFAGGVGVIGNYAYLADGQSGQKIIDVTDKQNPVLIGNLGAVYG